jgi:flagellar biosynthesis chaperone FliJ
LDRISKNEERLDNIMKSIKQLEEALSNFKSNKKDINLLNKYYGSDSWFKDKEEYEQNKIPKIKAGVLSEDAVWNMNEDIKALLDEMKLIIKEMK